MKWQNNIRWRAEEGIKKIRARALLLSQEKMRHRSDTATDSVRISNERKEGKLWDCNEWNCEMCALWCLENFNLQSFLRSASSSAFWDERSVCVFTSKFGRLQWRFLFCLKSRLLPFVSFSCEVVNLLFSRIYKTMKRSGNVFLLAMGFTLASEGLAVNLFLTLSVSLCSLSSMKSQSIIPAFWQLNEILCFFSLLA